MLPPPPRNPHHAQLTAQLVAAGFPAETITIRTQEGPLGTRLLVANAAGAYPTAGTRVMVLDGETGFAAVGLADLARSRGWLAHPPDATTLIELINFALFAGHAMADTASPMSATVKDGRLEVRFIRRVFPSLTRVAVTVTIRESGPEEMTSADADPAPPEPIPIDDLTELLRAMDAGSTLATRAAIRKVRPTGPREIAALARAATLMNDILAADAIGALGNSDAAALALRDAIAAGDPERREPVIKIAEEWHGAGFAGKLR